MSAPGRAEGRGIGSLGKWLPLLSLLALGSPVAAAALVAPALTLGEVPPLQGVAMALCVTALVGLVLAPVVLLRQLRRPVRSLARLRISMLAAGDTLHVVALGGVAVTVNSSPDGMLDVLRGAADGPLLAAFSLYAFSVLLTFGSACSCWSLLNERPRRVLLLVLDGVLLLLAGFAIAQLPPRPPESAPDDLTLPVVRHVITTLFVLRLLWRMLPLGLNAIERSGFRPLVASRHLRAEKSGFLAAISILSVLAVTLSSCALTTTLSVMGGFRQDLKRKILGNNAHVVVDRDYATIEGWDHLINTIESTDGVSGVAPFASGEVMISSATNLGTAVLRGIDPDRVGTVNDLPSNMRTGKLEYLKKPELLLRLPASMGGPLLPLLPDNADPEPEGTATHDASAAAGSNADADDQKMAALTERIAALETFLKESEQGIASPAVAPPPEDVLPGIIIGQELARSLRVYLGDEVNVVAPLGALGPSGPMPKSRPFRVAGIFYSGMYEYDMKFTYVALGTAQRFLGIGQAISGIEVKVDQADEAPLIANRLRAQLSTQDLKVKDWQQLNSRLFGALALEKLAMFIALGVSILVASFCIAGTLTLMVQEKGREVAILKAMGTKDSVIVGVFVIEGGLIGLLGATLGLFLGYMMCFAAEHFGIRMNPEVYYIDRLPVHIDATEFALTGVASVAVCLLITIYPALLASRLRPVDALRYE